MASASPFFVQGEVESASGELHLTLPVPAAHYVYADSWSVTFDGQAATPLAPLPAKRIFDPLMDEERDVLSETVTIRYRAPASGSVVEVALQGCSGEICFAPESFRYTLEGQLLKPESAAWEGVDHTDSAAWLGKLRIVATQAGYANPEEFAAFLQQREAGAVIAAQGGGLAAFAKDPARFLAERGWWLTMLLILVGGLLLNLTPCILPMIPINLAIIGAGSQQGSRSRGFLLGGVYGAGMALAYGVLGLSVVVTGGIFGSLQSHPLFNLVIGIVFVVLALALFDVFPIDLTRFQRSGGTSKAGVGVVLSLGAMSALLAGACVAPVVIAVLLLANKLYAGGSHAALLLPFLLGVGMALPWPLAGGGLAVLPRPGSWMNRVKYLFGVVVLLMAFYYGHLAWQGWRPAAGSDALQAGDRAAWEQCLTAAEASGKPILLDFWATWCKNCAAMSRTTLRDPAVAELLQGYEFIPVQAERPGEEPARSHLQALGVGGLPTYLILEP